MARERNCLCCGAAYNYCPTCNQDASKPKWMIEFDTEECKEIFNVVSAYNMKLVDKEGVKKVVDKYNVTDFSKFKPSIKGKLMEIVGVGKKPTVDTPVAPKITENKVEAKKPFNKDTKVDMVSENKSFKKNEAVSKAYPV